MNYQEQGRRAAQACRDRWQELAESLYKELAAERDTKIKEHEYEGALAKEQERELLEELNAAPPRSFHAAVVSLVEGVVWGVVSVVFIRATYDLFLLTFPLMGKSDESRRILAGVLALGLAVSFELWFRRLVKVLPEATFKIWVLFIALAPVLCLLAASITATFIRGEFNAAQGAIHTMEPLVASASEDSAISGNVTVSDDIVQKFYKTSGKLGNLLTIVATIGLEFTAAIALHEALDRLLPSLFAVVVPLRLRRVRRRMVNHASEIERWRRRPEVIREEFIRGAMLQRAQTAGAGEPVEISPAISLSTLLLIAISVFMAAFLFVLSQVYAEETVTIGFDLSVSSAGQEYVENVRAMETVISQLKPGSRLIVLPIANNSFSSVHILDARLSAKDGMFGERVKKGRLQLIELWRRKAQSLTAESKQTDIFGALAKASLVFSEQPSLKPVLILLSDMRHASGEYNFERMPQIDLSLVQRIQRDRLIAPLKKVRVSVLGVHAQNISVTYWMALRDFWTEYFRRAEAELKIFSPNRRLSNE